MKKSGLIVITIFIVALTFIYVAIPPHVVVVNSINAAVNTEGVFRNLIAEDNWNTWWPGKVLVDGNKKKFVYNELECRITNLLYNSIAIDIKKNNAVSTSFLNFFSIRNDSLKIEWTIKIYTGNNPYKKIEAYFEARNLKKKTAAILLSLKNYISQTNNIYGINIKEEITDLQYVLSSKQTFSSYPTIAQIYNLIKNEKDYILKSGGSSESFPMLHVFIIDSNHYLTQVAVPIKKSLPDTKIFTTQSTPKFAKFLVVEVIGGNNKIDQSVKSLNKYLADYQKTLMASPYQLLITDRTTIDSAKWITKIYYPIR